MPFPATKIIHWPTGPEPCCDEHAERLGGLGRFMGVHIAVTKAEDGDECTNCRNEAAGATNGD